MKRRNRKLDFLYSIYEFKLYLEGISIYAFLYPNYS
jgi:hypothetical protein